MIGLAVPNFFQYLCVRVDAFTCVLYIYLYPQQHVAISSHNIFFPPSVRSPQPRGAVVT